MVLWVSSVSVVMSPFSSLVFIKFLFLLTNLGKDLPILLIFSKKNYLWWFFFACLCFIILMISSYRLFAGVAFSRFSKPFRYIIKLLIWVPSFPLFLSPSLLSISLFCPPSLLSPSSFLPPPTPLRPLEMEIPLPPTATCFQSPASGCLGEKSWEGDGLAEQLGWEEFILGLFSRNQIFFFLGVWWWEVWDGEGGSQPQPLHPVEVTTLKTNLVTKGHACTNVDVWGQLREALWMDLKIWKEGSEISLLKLDMAKFWA